MDIKSNYDKTQFLGLLLIYSSNMEWNKDKNLYIMNETQIVVKILIVLMHYKVSLEFENAF